MEPKKLFVMTALTLIFVAFSFNPLDAAIREALANSAHLEARNIVSVINIMSNAPDGTVYRMEIKPRSCQIEISENFVVVTKETTREIYGIIKTPVQVQGGEFDCKDTRTLKMTRTGNILKVEK